MRAILLRILNVTLRGATLVSKLFLLVQMGRYLKVEEVGAYGLLYATVAFGIVLAGFEFYTYSTREALLGGDLAWGSIVRGHTRMVGWVHLVLLPVWVLLGFLNLLPHPYMFAFVPLLVLESISQEMNRLFIAMNRQVLASAILFMRMGSGAIAAGVLLGVQPISRSLSTVLWLWGAGVALSIILGVTALLRMRLEGWRVAPPRTWGTAGLKAAIPFLVAVLATRLLLTIDKFIVEWTGGPRVLGAYVFFMSLAMALTSLIEASTLAFFTPRALSLVRTRDLHSLDALARRAQTEVLVLSTVFTAAYLAVVLYALPILGLGHYETYAVISIPIVLAIVFMNLGAVPHYVLYAHGRGVTSMLSQLVGLTTFAVSAMALTQIHNHITMVPIALAVSTLAITMHRTWAVNGLRRARS